MELNQSYRSDMHLERLHILQEERYPDEAPNVRRGVIDDHVRLLHHFVHIFVSELVADELGTWDWCIIHSDDQP